jgi:amino acid transporter
MGSEDSDKRLNAEAGDIEAASQGPIIDVGPFPEAHEGDFLTTNEQRDLTRGLEQRHISLIALAGAIVCSSILTWL